MTVSCGRSGRQESKTRYSMRRRLGLMTMIGHECGLMMRQAKYALTESRHCSTSSSPQPVVMRPLPLLRFRAACRVSCGASSSLAMQQKGCCIKAKSYATVCALHRSNLKRTTIKLHDQASSHRSYCCFAPGRDRSKPLPPTLRRSR